MAFGQGTFITIRGVSPVDVGGAFLVGYLYFVNQTPFTLPFPDIPITSTRLESVGYVIVGLLYTIPVAFRRTSPLLSAALIMAATGFRHFIEPSRLILADLGILAMLYAITVYGPRWAHRTAAGLSVIGDFLVTVPSLTSPATNQDSASTWNTFLSSFTYIAAVLIAVYGVALARRSQLTKMQSLISQAQTAQHRADTEAELAVLEERSRIAREMHDIVAHTLSVVIAQADGGRYAAAKDSEAPVRALTTISDLARDALKDIRSIIGVLRDTDSSEQPTLPQPVDDDIESLVDSVRQTGVKVSLIRAEEPHSLPVGVGNALYRICQEALTNCLKHAGPQAEITVILHGSDSELTLQIDDDGRGAAAISDGKGHGIIGMVERANAFGGKVVSGPRPGGGFRVLATIPISHNDNTARSSYE